MRMALGLALAGGVWLAAGGEAWAQVVQREPTQCPETFFDGTPFPPDAQCFSDYTEATALAWRMRLAEAMICDVGDTDCGASAQAVISAAQNDHTLVYLDASGNELVPPQPCNIGFGVAGARCFVFWQGLTTSRTETVTTLDATLRSDAFETRITGALNGGLIFDQTVAGAVGDGAAQSALAGASVAITDAGGPGVVVFDPVLIERTETLIATDTEVDRQVQGDPVLTASSTTVFGVNGGSTGTPIGTLGPPVLPSGASFLGGSFDGDYGLCATSGATNQPPTGCENDEATLVVPFDASLFLVNLNTHSTILETISSTETWTIFEHWQVRGVVRALGVIHAAVQSGGYDLGLRFLRRMGDEGSGPRGFALPSAVTTSSMGGPGVRRFGWVEGYGTRARVDATGTTDAETRAAAGVAAGMTWVFPSGATLGFGLDHGRGGVDIAAAAESADIRLTQGALMAGIDRGDWFATGVLSFGSGEVEATTTLGGAATASYSLRTTGVQVEAGRRLRAGDWQITPVVGVDHLAVRTGAFTAGGVTAGAHSADRTRLFAGVGVARDWAQRGGVLTLEGSARVVQVVAGHDRMLPVDFGGAAMAVTAGPEGRTGLDLGLGLAWRAEGVEASLRYTGRFRDGAWNHGLTAGVRVRW